MAQQEGYIQQQSSCCRNKSNNHKNNTQQKRQQQGQQEQFVESSSMPAHAAQVGAYLLEQVAGLPTTVFYASEFRYAPPPLLLAQGGDATAARGAAYAAFLERGRA
jgi:glucosamine 6-phosphate synthetase-like amidotransferase/phosphosugar isomerase protein